MIAYHRPRFLSPSFRRVLLSGVSALTLLSLPHLAFAGSLREAVAAQSSARAAAVARSQSQSSLATAAAVASNANLTKAASKLKAAIAAQASAARAATSFNGLGAGALETAVGCTTCLDTAWVGADSPSEVVNPDGTYDVTVDQTQSRAILSWKSFNVGSKTTLTFDQQGNSDWVVLNRVVGDSAAPSQIMGSIKADGSVLVINQNGVVFGAGAQVNVHSLVATTMEIGRTTDLTTGTRTIAERNQEFLDYGLTGYAESTLTSSSSPTAYHTFSGTTDGQEHADAKVSVEQGATITANDGGMILLAAPTVTNAGYLSAADGQVSLVGVATSLEVLPGQSYASQNLTLWASDGSDTAVDPSVRGYLPLGGGGTVINTATGVIEADRGYVSLGGLRLKGSYGDIGNLSNANGTVINAGILASTTAVSANGAIGVYGDDITLAPGSIILVDADSNGETITQDADSVTSFKSSKVWIGDYFSTVAMGEGAMIVAPSGNVTIGRDADAALFALSSVVGTITIESGAVIDVSGLKDVYVPISAYNLTIDLYGNELADSGGYQDSFLYGQTVTIDARLSGVRDDGVAWIGSPLISAAAYYEAVGVSAAQLMTSGGNVTLGTSGALNGANSVAASKVIVKSGASIDVSGGWATYEAGTVKTTLLLTSSGKVVDISNADPLKDTYVAVYTGSSQSHDRWGVANSYATLTGAKGTSSAASYTEGRDAGTLTIRSAQVVYEGDLAAQAYAGTRQLAESTAGTGTSGIYGDDRSVQEAGTQLPSGGLLFIQQVGDADTKEGATVGAGGGDIKVVAAGTYAREDGVTVLSDALLSQSGLAQVSLWTSGAITVGQDATVSLNPGGVFDAYSGRSITIAGTISVPSGSILLETAYLTAYNNGSVFTTADDALAVGSFDITVTGTLSVAGLWVNDQGKTGLDQTGDAWLDGGNITIVSAASVTDRSGSSVANANTALTGDLTATDVSGSIYLQNAALIDLSGGGRVTQDGDLQLTGQGGDLALINQTAFHQLEADYAGKAVGTAYGQISGFRIHYKNGSNVTEEVQINPDQITATVQFDPATIKAAGFAGGGIFTLWAPDVAFGSGSADDTSLATVLPLSFFQSGFADYVITSYKTALLDNTFVDASSNSLGGTNAVLQTQTFRVKDGETLTLSQSLLPVYVTEEQRAALLGLETGGDVTSILAASVPTDTWDQKAVNLTLDGMVELVVESGGTIATAPGATLTTAKLLNQGTIRMPGGSIVQQLTLPAFLSTGTVYGIRDLSDIFTVEADGSIVETKGSTVSGKTNANLAYGSPIYLLGELDADQGVVLASGSVTDLSGVSVINPHTLAGVRTGKVYAGGSTVVMPQSTLDTKLYRSSTLATTSLLSIGTEIAGRTLTIASGANVDLDGAADTYTIGTSSVGNGSLGAAITGSGGSSGLSSSAVWSDAGAISATNGFSISSGAVLSAHGGSASAEGGILELSNVVLTQTAADAANELSADQLMQSGFTTLAAVGSLNSDGDVSLTLGRALYVTSRGEVSDQYSLTNNDYAVTIGAGGNLSITAPYIGLISAMDKLPGGAATGIANTHSISLNATKSFDIAGAVLFDRSLSDVTLSSAGDLRLIGVQDYKITYGVGTTSENTALTGQLAANGTLTLIAAQVYPTTGTTFTITTPGDVTFARSTVGVPSAPYSAGGDLAVSATNITQGGVVRVPLGSLTLDASGSLELTNGSYTEVSANGLIIPYGTTTDGSEWYFTPTGGTALDAPPEKVLTLSGDSVTIAAGATVNVSGGGDITAYEFSAGTGGSRDVLNLYNDDTYTSQTGCTYSNCAQVYAIVSGLSDAAVATYDPVYSANYSNLSSVAGIGLRVRLDLGDGLKWYTLLPAQYATLSGGRLVVVRGTSTQAAGSHVTLADGTVLATGVYGNALSGSAGSSVYTFAVQSQSVFEKYSTITLTSGNEYFAALASSEGTATPRLAVDAGRLVLDAVSSLTINAAVQASADEGGRGAQVDIGGSAIAIVSTLPADTSAALYITADAITNLNAESVLIGGTRTDNSDGTTTLDISAGSITVENDNDHAIRSAEIVLAATGSITIADGSVITATGTMNDTRDGAYVLGDPRSSGTGALLRVANGVERLTSRSNFTSVGRLTAGAATLSGTSVMFDSSGTMGLSDHLILQNATSVAVGAGRIGVGVDDASYDGVVFTDAMRAVLAQSGGRLTLRSQTSLDFADGTYSFGDIRFDAGTLAGVEGGAVVVNGDTVTLSNAGADGTVCGTCVAKDGNLTINADEIVFSGGTLATQATTLDTATTAKLTKDTTVVLPAGTVLDWGTLLEDATIILPAGTVISLPAGSGVATPADAGGTLAAGIEITAATLSYAIASGTSFTFTQSVKTNSSTLTAGRTYTVNQAATATVPGGTAMTVDSATSVTATDFFGGGVTLAAANGIFVTGQNAGLDAGSAALTLHTPYLGDRASSTSAVVPDLTLATTGAVVIDTLGAGSVDLAKLGGIAGTGLAISGGSVVVSGTTVHASAGTVDIVSATGVTLSGGAVVEAPGFTTTYGDDGDSITQSSPGGTVSLTAKAGDIVLGAGTLVSVGGDAGDAGRLELSAVAGDVVMNGSIDGTAGTDGAGGTFALETGGSVDLAALNTLVGGYGFTGGFEVHSHSGDLTLAKGQTLKSGSVVLTADGGYVTIGGTIDTSGVNGGDIELYGNKGVTLAATAKLDAHSTGYDASDSRQASAGDVTLGTDFVTGTTSTSTDGVVSGTSGVISVASGALIDLSVTNTKNRVVPLESGLGYYYVDADTAGTLTFRAPVIDDGAGNQTVAVTVTSAASVKGAAGVVVEGFRRWDLARVAASGSYTGVTADAGGNVTLDVSAGLDTLGYDSTSKTFTATDLGSGLNFLGDRDWTGSHETVVSFVQDLDLSAATTGSGGLAALATAYGDDFTAAPGVELANDGTITLASNWNLAAGVVDVSTATAAGLMARETNATYGTLYHVVDGAQAALLESYTGMVYRTGGSVTGAAPVLTLRAGGDLTINGIINDGFFSFADDSDETYLASQTGTQKTVFGFFSGTTSSVIGSSSGPVLSGYTFTASSGTTGTLQTVSSATDPLVYVPYSADANSAAPEQHGNPFASMELFPTLGDGSGDQMSSATYRLIGGAAVSRSAGDGLWGSADPLATTSGTMGSVVLNGYSYESGGTEVEVVYGYRFGNGSTNTCKAATAYCSSYEDWLSMVETMTYGATYTNTLVYYGASGSTTNTSSSRAYLLPNSTSSSRYVVNSEDDLVYVKLGLTDSSTGIDLAYDVTNLTLRSLALSGEDPYLSALYLSNKKTVTTAGEVLTDAQGHSYTMGGNDFFTIASTSTNPQTNTNNNSVTIVASLKTLNYILGTYVEPTFPSSLDATTVTVPGMIRTGTGDIAMVASGNVDLRGSTAESASNSVAAAVAVYTAGQRAASGTVAATDVSTGRTVSVNLGANMASGGLYLENGGDIVVTAGNDVLGNSSTTLSWSTITGDSLGWMSNVNDATSSSTQADQQVKPSGFATGIGALAGGNVTVSAGRDLDDVAVAATPAIRTVALTLADGGTAQGVDFLGSSAVALRAGRDVLGGMVLVTSGGLSLTAGRDITGGGWVNTQEILTRLRVLNATATVQAGRNALLSWDGTMPWTVNNKGGWYSGIAGLSAVANGDLGLVIKPGVGTTDGAVLPGSVTLAAIGGDLEFWKTKTTSGDRPFILMEADADGQLVLLAGGDIGAVTLVMDDADPANFAGPFATYRTSSSSGARFEPARGYGFPTVTSATTEAQLRLYHNQDLTHADDDQPALVMAGGDITNMTLVVPKQARVVAGGDIVNMVFYGQNLHATDITRVAAAGDITATSVLTTAADLVNGSQVTESEVQATLQGNLFVIGGPGSFFLEAGGDMGPFLTSAALEYTAQVSVGGQYLFSSFAEDYAGGVLSVGYDWNPWLKSAVKAAGGGADLYVMFGLGATGPDYAGFADTYVNPANTAALTYGGYGATLAAWLAEHYGLSGLSEAQAYAAFLALPPMEQRVFLLSQVYFNELEQVAVATSESYQQYSRGYAAVNTLFPAANGYTANGMEGGAVDTDLVHTGDLDLRLSTIQSTRGGDIRILGPGGDILAGSVVRTSTQAERRNYDTYIYSGSLLTSSYSYSVAAIPTGLEGIITLRGGTISSFTDGSLVLNQSRLFTENGGDIVLWSSNGDLNAGQGPKTSASFSPIQMTFDWNLFGAVDEANSVSGAGIAAFQPDVGIEAPDVYMLAPRGTVDAGDAGIRVAGDISILAYQVHNAENISVGGSSFGVPVVAGADVGALTSASDTGGQAANAAEDAARASRQTGARVADIPSIITVEVIGYGGGDAQPAPQPRRDRHSYDPNGAVRVIGLGEEE